MHNLVIVNKIQFHLNSFLMLFPSKFSSIRGMNRLPSFPNLHLPTDFADNCFFPPLKIQHNPHYFSSSPFLRLHCKCFSAASSSSTSHRRTTNYPESSWDCSQIQSLNTTTFSGDEYLRRREKLKEKVKCDIKEKGFADQLMLFDSLQKLGVAYHFEKEIKELLNLMKSSEGKLRMDQITEDAYVMALYFRISREHGFEVSEGMAHWLRISAFTVVAAFDSGLVLMRNDDIQEFLQIGGICKESGAKDLKESNFQRKRAIFVLGAKAPNLGRLGARLDYENPRGWRLGASHGRLSAHLPESPAPWRRPWVPKRPVFLDNFYRVPRRPEIAAPRRPTTKEQF